MNESKTLIWFRYTTMMNVVDLIFVVTIYECDPSLAADVKMSNVFLSVSHHQIESNSEFIFDISMSVSMEKRSLLSCLVLPATKSEN